MRLTANMLKVLVELHNSGNGQGTATFRTAIALCDRELVSIRNGGFPARTEGLAFPELAVELTDKGKAFCVQKFNMP